MEPNINSNLDLSQRIDSLEYKLDLIYKSTEKTRKYFLWTFIITIVLFVLPLLGLVFVIPSFMSNYVNQAQTLGL